MLGDILKPDWSGNKAAELTSGGFHALSSCPLFNSSRTQTIISLSSCEAEWRAIVSSASDVRWNIYIYTLYIYVFAQFLSLRLGPRWAIMSSQIPQVRANL